MRNCNYSEHFHILSEHLSSSISSKKQRPVLDDPVLNANSGPSTSGACSTMPVNKKERRRQKKMRKEKLRQSQLRNTDDFNTKRHKHKHKCGDENCKLRKHKKRRKHKKHHRNSAVSPMESPSITSIKRESNTEEGDLNRRLPESIDKNVDERLDKRPVVVLNTNDCKINMQQKQPVHLPLIKQEVFDEEEITSSHTENSVDSSYVSSEYN